MINTRIFTTDGKDFFQKFPSVQDIKMRFRGHKKIWKIQVYDRTGVGMLCYENKQRQPKLEV